MKYFILLIAIGVVSCVSAPKHPDQTPNTIFHHLLQPRDLGRPFRAQQLLTTRWSTQARTTEVVLEVTKEQVTLSVLVPMFPTPLQAKYDGKVITVDSALRRGMPFEFERVLADITLVYAAESKIAAALDSKYSIVAEKGVRTILAEGRPVIVITYGSKDMVTLKNLVHGYEIGIQNLSVINL